MEKLGVENMDKVIGKTDFDFFTKPHAEQAYREEWEMIKSKKPVIGKIIEETYLNGKTAWVSTTKVPWYDEKGNIIGTLGVSRDVTQQKIPPAPSQNASRGRSSAHLNDPASRPWWGRSR